MGSEKFGGIRTEAGPAGYAVTVAELGEGGAFTTHRNERVTL